MFKQLIEDCFGDLKAQDPSSAKFYFGFIWAAFASKKVVLKDGTIEMTWREISAELAKIYNEWFSAQFTTDAFYNVVSVNGTGTPSKEYMAAITKVASHPNCLGVFQSVMPIVFSSSKEMPICDINMMTGEHVYSKQQIEKGKLVGLPIPISKEEYERICYGARERMEETQSEQLKANSRG